MKHRTIIRVNYPRVAKRKTLKRLSNGVIEEWWKYLLWTESEMIRFSERLEKNGLLKHVQRRKNTLDIVRYQSLLVTVLKEENNRTGSPKLD